MNLEKMRKQLARSFSDHTVMDFDPVYGDEGEWADERNHILNMMYRKHGHGEVKIWVEEAPYLDGIKKVHLEVVK